MYLHKHIDFENITLNSINNAFQYYSYGVHCDTTMLKWIKSSHFKNDWVNQIQNFWLRNIKLPGSLEALKKPLFSPRFASDILFNHHFCKKKKKDPQNEACLDKLIKTTHSKGSWKNIHIHGNS